MAQLCDSSDLTNQTNCIQQSTLNPSIKEELEQKRFPNGGFNFSLLETKDELEAIDIAKAYTSILVNGDFGVFDVDSVIEPFKAEKQLKMGFYFIRTQNYFPFKGNGWYDYQLVQEALNDQLVTHSNISHQILSHPCESNDELYKKFVNVVYESVPNGAKLLVNSLIGSFAMNSKKVPKSAIITSNWDEASYYVHKHPEAIIHTMIMPTADSNGKKRHLYRVQAYNELIKLSTNKLTHVQIVQRCYLAAYKLMKFIQVERPLSTIVHIKTDCVYFTHDQELGKIQLGEQPKLGGYRQEKVSKDMKLNASTRFINSTTVPYSPQVWNEVVANPDEHFNYKEILKYNRVFVEGPAGTAKSYLIKQIRDNCDQLGVTCSVLSFTNTAANNIEGRTLHSFLGINQSGRTNESALKKAFQKHVIIIDEINQVPLFVYKFLFALPKYVHLYGFGDKRQETPVEPHLEERGMYVDSSMFIDLFNRNKITLTKQCRANPDYANACAKYHDVFEVLSKTTEAAADRAYQLIKRHVNAWKRSSFESFLNQFVEWKTIDGKRQRVRNTKKLADAAYSNADTKCDINIVKTNALRQLINFYWMKANAPADATQITKEDNEHMLLYNGLPVVANETNTLKTPFEGRFSNNEMYVVDFFDEKIVTLSARILNKNQKVSENLTMPMDIFTKFFSAAYAVTTYKIEGATIDKPHAIWEFNRMHHKTRYTALTRTTDPKLVTIYDMDWLPILLSDEVAEGTIARIYKITCTMSELPATQKNIYIGSTQQSIEARFEEHKKSKGKTKLYKAMKNADSVIELVEEFTATSKRHILERERYYIEIFDAVNNGLNMKYL